MNEKNKFLLQYYAIYFLKGFLFLKQYLILLLNSNLTPVQVSTIISAYSVVSMFIEIPTGALSDYFGCKKTLVFGIFFHLIGYIIILFKKNFFTFCLFYGFYGLYETLFSGSKESLIYNNIKYLDLRKTFIKYKSRSKIVHLIALTISSFLGGFLLKYNKNYIIIVDIFVLILYIFVILSINEHRSPNLQKLNKNYIRSIANGFKYVLKHYTLRRFLLFEGVWYSTWMIFINYSSLFYKEIDVKFLNIGTMNSLQVLIVAIVQSSIIGYFINRDVYSNAKIFLVGGIFCVLSTYLYSGMISYALLVLYFFCIQSGDLLFYPKIQRLIPAKSRSIIISIENFIDSITKLVLLNLFGVISSKYSYRNGFLSMSIFYITLSVIFYVFLSRDKHLRKIER